MVQTKRQITASFSRTCQWHHTMARGSFLMYAKIPQLKAKEPQPHEKAAAPNNKNKQGAFKAPIFISYYTFSISPYSFLHC